jgi:hypothetical protein
MPGISEVIPMKALLLIKLAALVLLLIPQQVPGAATQALPHAGAAKVSTEPVVRQLDLELRRLSQELPVAQKVSAQQLQQIETLWQQLFARQQSHVLNKLYNQYQVQLQQALQSTSVATAEEQARQMTVLRQRLLTAMTLQPQ